MTHLRLVWRLLLTRGMSHLLTVVVIALGTGMILTAMATQEAERTAVSQVAARFPLVAGGEVDAVSLVLGSLTRLHDLGPGVDVSVLHELESDPRVGKVVPQLGGHAVGPYPLLGTSPAFLEPRSQYPLAAGRSFRNGEDEVALGSEAARGLGLSVGSSVTIEHRHAGAPSDPGALTVVGVLEPTGTVTDRTLLCSVEAIFRSHHGHGTTGHHGDGTTGHHGAGTTGHHGAGKAGHHEDGKTGHHGDGTTGHHGAGTKAGAAPQRVSSLLIHPVDRKALLSLQEDLEAREGVTVALTGQTLRRLGEQLNMGGKLLRMVLGGVVLLTLLALLLSMYGSTLSQAREVAIMRVLGARRLELVGVMALTSLAVITTGLLAGLGLALWLAGSTEQLLRHELGLQATVEVWSTTTLSTLLISALLLAVVGIQPAVAAYRVQAAEALSRPAGSGHATRSYLRWSLRFLIPLAVLIGLQIAMSQHGAEVTSPPLDAPSAELFRHMAATEKGSLPPALEAKRDSPVTVEGYMYDLGDPYVVQDFYLVAFNPRLPRCPFCYRAPTRVERILVRSGGRELDVTPSLVRVRGVLHIAPEGDDPFVLDLETFDVVIPD